MRHFTSLAIAVLLVLFWLTSGHVFAQTFVPVVTMEAGEQFVVHCNADQIAVLPIDSETIHILCISAKTKSSPAPVTPVSPTTTPSPAETKTSLTQTPVLSSPATSLTPTQSPLAIPTETPISTTVPLRINPRFLNTL